MKCPSYIIMLSIMGVLVTVAFMLYHFLGPASFGGGA
jgi:hypothetical protein